MKRKKHLFEKVVRSVKLLIDCSKTLAKNKLARRYPINVLNKDCVGSYCLKSKDTNLYLVYINTKMLRTV